jgi:imidazole glycerol-phosphate synthase subunit HisF
MLQKRIIPCLLLKDGLVAKTIQFNNPRHIGEPIYAIKIFNDYEVDELVIVNIMASRRDVTRVAPHKNEIPLSLISKISDESCMPITYGGGIRSINDIHQLLRAGVEKVCINTYGIKNTSFIHDASSEFGSQSIVASIDVKINAVGMYEVFTNGGQVPTGIDARECAIQMEQAGAGEILLNSIDRDGTMGGYDITLIKLITSAVHIPVIALGGARTMNDFSLALHEGRASAAAAGSMFVYFGKKKAVLINYPTRKQITETIR